METILKKQFKYLIRQKSSLIITIVYFLLISFASLKNIFIDHNVQYFTHSIVLTCLIFTIFQITFWTEKVTGVLEQILTTNISIKKYIFFSAISIAILNIFLSSLFYFFAFIINFISLNEFIFNIFDIICMYLIIGFITIIFTVVNGYTMTSTSKSVAKIFQFLLIIIIFSSFLTFNNSAILSFSTILFGQGNAILFGFIILSLIGGLSFLKTSNEKTILTAGE